MRFVAEDSGLDIELCVKGKSGILQSRKTRAAFLSDPKHASWMNQAEIWSSILVRKLLKRGSLLPPLTSNMHCTL